MLLHPRILFVLQVLSQTHYRLIKITPSFFALVLSFKIGVSPWSCVRLLRPSDGLISNSIAGLMSVRTWEQSLLCAGNLLRSWRFKLFLACKNLTPARGCSMRRHGTAQLWDSPCAGDCSLDGRFAGSGSSLQLVLWSGTEESHLFWGKLGITIAALY